MTLAGVSTAFIGLANGGDRSKSDGWSFLDAQKLKNCYDFDCNQGKGKQLNMFILLIKHNHLNQFLYMLTLESRCLPGSGRRCSWDKNSALSLNKVQEIWFQLLVFNNIF